MKRSVAFARLAALSLSAATVVVSLSACAPLMIGSAVGGAMVATDRRTSGAQLEDQGIEMRAASRLREQFGDRARVIVTSYNRRVLLTGEVPSEADRATANRLVAGVENVREIVDELGVQSSPSFTARSSDSLVTARVKAALQPLFQLGENLPADGCQARGAMQLLLAGFQIAHPDAHGLPCACNVFMRDAIH